MLIVKSQIYALECFFAASSNKALDFFIRLDVVRKNHITIVKDKRILDHIYSVFNDLFVLLKLLVIIRSTEVFK